MKTIVITGSARGFGFEMLKLFKKQNFNVVICDVNEESINNVFLELTNIEGEGKVLSFVCDVTKEDQVQNLINLTLQEVGSIDIWINNAGVNQPDSPIWDVDTSTINRLIDIDLKGTILSSKLIMKTMIEQGFGQIYNVEGYGSNDATKTGLSIYGTAKRAVTYFTEALANEVDELNLNIQIGKITPGIMITNFITTSLGDGEKIVLPEKTKKVYNILGDYPSTIANYVVPKIIKNKRNFAKIVWLTNTKAFFRFLTYGFKKKKRNFFKD